MVDISKCDNRICPSRYKCFRYVSKPDPRWQSYGKYTPDKDGKCDSFWEFEPKDLDKLQKEHEF